TPTNKREKFLRVEIHRASDLRRRRLARNDVVLLRAGLKKKAAVLNRCAHTWIVQGVGVINPQIGVGEAKNLIGNVHNIQMRDMGSVQQRVSSDPAPVTEQQDIPGLRAQRQR